MNSEPMVDSVYKVLLRCFSLLPIKRNKVLFTDYYGSKYGCNPKYISRALSKTKGIDIVWAFADPGKHPERREGRAVKWGALKFLYELATAKVFITNFRMPLWYDKRNGQFYIQTWHSSLRLKKIEGDTESSLPPHYVNMAKHDSAQTDYVLAGCRNSHDTFRNSFWYSGNIVDYGTPRNDVLIDPPEGLAPKIKERLSLQKDKKIVLYAPTFRKDKGTKCYELDINKLLEALQSKFQGEWIVLMRLHPHLSGCDELKQIEGLIDVTHYDDVQELLLVSDVLISDYSSLIFDFAISKRPIFLYAADAKEYCSQDRSLYFELSSLPFPLAESNEQLAKNIELFDPQLYKEEVDSFSKSVGSFEKGTAAEQTVNLVKKLIEQ